MQKLATTLADAQVDLNPHQIDAALFAFRSPLSKGAILADEVGLGKTIEAGILLSQKWAAKKAEAPHHRPSRTTQAVASGIGRQVLFAVGHPRNQDFERLHQAGKPESVQSVRNHHRLVSLRPCEGFVHQAVNWHLVIVDEAHRLQNVYKPTNSIARNVSWSPTMSRCAKASVIAMAKSDRFT